MSHLIQTTERHRLANEEQAELFLKELKENNNFEVIKYSCVKRSKKEKGEIVDEWVRVEVTKQFNDEAEPVSSVKISYDGGYGNV